MPRVLRTPRANQDLLELWLYVARDSPRNADRPVESIGEKCELLADFPEMGRLREDLAPSLRSFAVGNYVVFYRAREGGIEVIRVLHGARDVETVLREEELES
jgi:toxin ParE1/3/4